MDQFLYAIFNANAGAAGRNGGRQAQAQAGGGVESQRQQQQQQNHSGRGGTSQSTSTTNNAFSQSQSSSSSSSNGHGASASFSTSSGHFGHPPSMNAGANINLGGGQQAQASFSFGGPGRGGRGGGMGGQFHLGGGTGDPGRGGEGDDDEEGEVVIPTFGEWLRSMEGGRGMRLHRQMPPGGPGFHVDYDGWEVPPVDWLREQHEPPVGPPPASRRFISRLPDVTVTPEDLVDESNRECSVCMEPHAVGSKALKLPCQHLFHRQCVIEWLEKHCTCPVCRFELETEDRAYEAERRKRMKTRRLRMKPGVLERKSAIEIKRILESVGIPLTGCIEKSDMIARLLDSGLVDIVTETCPTSPYRPTNTPTTEEDGGGGGAEGTEEEVALPTSSSFAAASPPSFSSSSSSAPSAAASTSTSASSSAPPSTISRETDISTSSSSVSPLPFTIQTLRSMGVGALRRYMNQANISSEGCIEKEDMVQRIATSGKSTIIEQAAAEEGDVEMVAMDEGGGGEGGHEPSRNDTITVPVDQSVSGGEGEGEEWVVVDEEGRGGECGSNASSLPMSSAPDAPPAPSSSTTSSQVPPVPPPWNPPTPSAPLPSCPPRRSVSSSSASSSPSFTSSSSSYQRTELNGLSISELRRLMVRLDVSTDGCLEKEDMMERLIECRKKCVDAVPV